MQFVARQIKNFISGRVRPFRQPVNSAGRVGVVFLAEMPNVIAWAGVALVIVGGMVAATSAPDEEAIGAAAAL